MTTLTADEVEVGRRSFLVQLRAELARDLDEVAVSRTDLRDLVTLLEALKPVVVDRAVIDRDAIALAYHRYYCREANRATCPEFDEDDCGYADELAEVLAWVPSGTILDVDQFVAAALAALYPKATEGKS